MRTFSGPTLREVAFPLGGIGTGAVSLGGRGDLRDWEIFHRPGKGITLPYTFFSLWAQRGGEQPVARIAERRLLPPYVDGAGLPPGRASGLPRLREAEFTGHYPFASLRFLDPDLPVDLTLRAWNPFVPLDEEASGMPLAVFDWVVRNTSDRLVDFSLAFSLLNPIGFDGAGELRSRRNECFGGNRNAWRDESGVRGLWMTGAVPEDDPRYGTLALTTDHPAARFRTRWERGGWWDDLQAFWQDFREDGFVSGPRDADPSPDGETDVGTLAIRVSLEPDEEQVLPFVLSWHFPNLTNTWNREEGVRGQRLGVWYATRWADAWSAAVEFHRSRDRLFQQTEAFRSASYEGSLPPEAADAAGSQLSTLRTPTCLRTEDGVFHAFEGCSDRAGCCPLDCTHVWNYEQALAFLFPGLERSMRRTDLQVNTLGEGPGAGRMSFRTLVPTRLGLRWEGPPAADGQMGALLKLYREWRICGDRDFLHELWPQARRALEYAWTRWDRDRDGVMEGEQHNTYDIEFYGPNTMTGTLYLGALAAAAEMASELGERGLAEEYARLRDSGSARYDALLWNGEYYRQEVRPPTEPAGGLGPGVQSLQPGGELRYQVGDGCLADQLLGQWFCHVVGLGYVLPKEHVRGAIRAVFRHNFRRELARHESCQRTYALNEEGGLLLCTWPRGGRPRYPFPYADEVWTGVEYQVAAHLIYEGFVDEGLEIVRTVRRRHDGERRNPWDEFECGHHYARALSSWSLVTALTGMDWDGRRGRLSFAPRGAMEDAFFCTGTAWGRARFLGGRARLEVLGGSLPEGLAEVSAATPGPSSG